MAMKNGWRLGVAALVTGLFVSQQASAIELVFEAGSRHGPVLSCVATDKLPLQAPQSISQPGAIQAAEQDTPGNLRGGFLIVLAVLGLLGLILRRMLLRRQKP